MHAVWLLKSLGYQPRHTIRIVLFANEEFGLDGAKKYAKEGLEENRKHILCIESDGGSGAPRGFSLPAIIHDKSPELIKELDNLLARYGCKEWTQGGSGADVSQIIDDGVILCGYRADSQRYFDYHHTSQDDIKSVHPRELELGSASIASFLYFFDKKL
jgi:Zn-dependent M28 family amino/carboxypeptidase